MLCRGWASSGTVISEQTMMGRSRCTRLPFSRSFYNITRLNKPWNSLGDSWRASFSFKTGNLIFSLIIFFFHGRWFQPLRPLPSPCTVQANYLSLTLFFAHFSKNLRASSVILQNILQQLHSSFYLVWLLK